MYFLCQNNKDLKYTFSQQYVITMSCTHFRVNLHSIVAQMSRNSLLEKGIISKIEVTAMRFELTTTIVNEHATF